MARGIDGREVFGDDQDRRTFLALLSAGLRKVGYRCYAWALMANHYHLLLRATELPLDRLMRSLNSTYARYYGRKHKRKGYLFQDRFRSIATQDQGYLEELLRYVHLNPVRAGICRGLRELERYQWCGHGAVMGTRTCAFMDVGAVLRKFGASRDAARRAYLRFMAAGLSEAGGEDEVLLRLLRDSNEQKRSMRHTGSWVIGDRQFVADALAADRNHRIRLHRYAQEGWDLERLCGSVAASMGVKPNQVLRRSKRTVGAESRKVLGYVGHRLLGIPVTEIARYLGITGPSVSAGLDAGERIARERGIDKLYTNLRP
jgi:putative transposase